MIKKKSGSYNANSASYLIDMSNFITPTNRKAKDDKELLLHLKIETTLNYVTFYGIKIIYSSITHSGREFVGLYILLLFISLPLFVHCI